MLTIVVPFRGPGGKQRLAPLAEPERAAVAQAMLGDVLAACAPVGETVVVAPVEAHAVASAAGAVRVVADPGRGQGAAVEAALTELDGPVLVVNADLPCATAADVAALLTALPAGALALVEAA